jgi:Transcriptional regulators
MFMEECAEFRITPVQYSVLTVLARQPGLDQATLGVQVGIDRATLAGVLSRLVRRGLIDRRASETDRRMKLASLSVEGQALLKRIDQNAQRAHDRTIAPLPPERRAAFLRDLTYLVSANNGYGRTALDLP